MLKYAKVIMYGGAMGSGNIHDRTRIPIMRAGRAGGPPEHATGRVDL